MSDLLFEIGMEEIPAGFLQPALQQLQDNFIQQSAALGLSHGQVRTLGTPRRLALMVNDLALRQPDRREELLGPSKKAGFDDQGQPSKAAFGFARSKGVDASALQLVDTPKGEYLMLVREVVGRPTSELLPDLLKALLMGFSFAKSMRWGANQNAFARPIHWLVALNDDQLVEIEHDEIVSGRYSRGHRFMAPDEFEIQGAGRYVEQLAERRVVVDPLTRRQQVLVEIKQAVGKTFGAQDAQVAVDEDLVETVTNLVEYPVGVCGSFAEKFLQLPPEVLITSMREHQKYFPVVDGQGQLLPGFVAVNNTVVNDIALTRTGHERVLNARLEDALFFFNSDRHHSLEGRYQDLEGIVFQAQLGTMLEKSERIIKLSGLLAEKLDPLSVAGVCRTARLSKIDLLTDMVGEFPSLQGVMGAAYGVHDGEDSAVALGIADHYLPKRAGDDLPATSFGALVGLADRIDTIVGCFGIGQVPTGTTDPFGLRRLALAVLHIIADRGYELSLSEVVSKALALYGSRVDGGSATVEAVIAFIKGRFVNDCVAAGLDGQAVDAVCSVAFDDVNDCRKKIEALAAIRGEDAFPVLAASFKRIRNILKNHQGQALDPSLLLEAGEKDLARIYAEIEAEVQPSLMARDYGQALTGMLRLKGPVDTFFENVMVMAEDEGIRNNRLNLLAAIGNLFLAVGDISKMQE